MRTQSHRRRSAICVTSVLSCFQSLSQLALHFSSLSCTCDLTSNAFTLAQDIVPKRKPCCKRGRHGGGDEGWFAAVLQHFSTSVHLDVEVQGGGDAGSLTPRCSATPIWCTLVWRYRQRHRHNIWSTPQPPPQPPQPPPPPQPLDVCTQA